MDADSSTNVITVKLRVSPELKQKISESAEKYNRSMNADMVARLEQSFSHGGLQGISTDELLAEISNRVDVAGGKFGLLKLNL